MLKSRSFHGWVLIAAMLLVPGVAAVAEEPPAAAPGVPVVAPDAVMTPAALEAVPDPIFLAGTYWCTASFQNCGRTWNCGKTCQVGQSCRCLFQFGQTPEGNCIIDVVGAFCIGGS